MIRNLILTVALSLTFSLASRGEEIPRLNPRDFAILPWGWTAGDKQVLEDVKACGFNVAGFVSPDAVPAVAAAGLQGIVSDPSMSVGDDAASLSEEEVTKRVSGITSRFKDNPAVYGYYLRDEPKVGLYPTLARFAAAVKATAPNQLPYINLFPNVVDAKAIGATDYTDYVQRFIDTVKPTFLSYDHYALMDDGSLKAGYFQNLETMRTLSLKHQLPFWNIVLSVAHFRYAEPSEDGLRFQMYTTLAYGARGISYFTYFSPPTGNYRLGAIDAFGHKTATWESLRRMNLQIHRLGPTYIQLKSINVFHHPTVPAECKGIATARVVEAANGGEFVVGEFEGPNGRPYAMIVNKDLHHSTTLDVKFKAAGPLAVVNAWSGNLDAWGGEAVWLAPGQGVLLTTRP